MAETKQISEHSWAAHLDDGRVYVLSNRLDGANMGSYDTMWQLSDRNWERFPQTFGDAKVVSYGWRNNIPTAIRDIVSDNNLVPGIINRQLGLIWGQGPHFLRTQYVDGKISQEWVEDREIERWLDSWDYTAYLRGCIIDYLHLGGFYDLRYLERGHRIGFDPKFAMLEHIPAKNARLEWPENGSRRFSDVRRIAVGNFENACVDTGVTSFPVFDRRNPAKYPVSASYNRLEPFARDFYALPQFWGALRWIVRGSEIPAIFKYVTDNGINLAYHVHSSSAYWDMRRDVLRREHPEWTDVQVEKEIGNITVKLLDSMVSVLTGKENAGKLFHSIDVVDDNGNTQQWKIEAIDQKIKDFVESQIKIGDASVSAITSGMGLHPSLSNVMVNGKLASGSELLYAYKLYLHSDVEIASGIVLEPINRAIEFNFPNRGVRLAFFHQSIQSEEALSSSQRLKNN